MSSTSAFPGTSVGQPSIAPAPRTTPNHPSDLNGFFMPFSFSVSLAGVAAGVEQAAFLRLVRRGFPFDSDVARGGLVLHPPRLDAPAVDVEGGLLDLRGGQGAQVVGGLEPLAPREQVHLAEAA